MKILAVRGRNLASLAGQFEVDFAKPPLDRAGLIAITGPTGAGKTTLLDAMCLALFDRTPRFGNRGGVMIGRPEEDAEQGLRAHDVRGILRHGTSEGWAEVDFLGVDDRPWRARWEVRRARGRSDGRIQAQTMQLIQLFEPRIGRVVVGDRKSDVLEAIEARLGLDFDQFRRSVLLAQGEFAAFLEASGNARADLLERMTGTGLYRQLGAAAWERAKRADAERELVRRELASFTTLAAADRVTLEQALADRRAAAQTLERSAQAAAAALRWYRREAELDEALVAAKLEGQAAASACAALADEATLLARVERVAGIRERIGARERIATQAAERTRDLEFLRGDLVHIDAQLAELRAGLTSLDEARTRARERRRRLAPELERARALDGQIHASVDERGRVAAKQLVAGRQLDAAERELEGLGAGLGVARQRLADGVARLDAAAGLDPISAQWTHYKALIQQQLRALDQRAGARRRVVELEPRKHRCELELGEAKAGLVEARRRKTQARNRLRKVERELAERASLADLRFRQQGLERARERLAKLREISQVASQLEVQAGRISAERGEGTVERDHHEAERARVEAALVGAESIFEEAQRGLRRLEAVRDLVAHRVDLEAGEACPVCGATEHPAAGEAAPVDAEVEAQRERVRELLRARDGLQQQRGNHHSRVQAARARLDGLELRRAELQRDREAAQLRWTEALAEGPVWTDAFAARGPAGPDADRDTEIEIETATETATVAPTPPPIEAAPEAGQLMLLGVATQPRPLPTELEPSKVEPVLWSLDDTIQSRWAALTRERDDIEARLEAQQRLQGLREQADREHDQRRERLDAVERERDGLTRDLDDTRSKLDELAGELSERELELHEVGTQARAVLAMREPSIGTDFTRSTGSTDSSESWAGTDAVARPFTDLLAREGVELLARLDAAVREHLGIRAEVEQTREALRALDSRRIELASTLAARREQVEEVGAELARLDATIAEHRAARAGLLDGRDVVELGRELEAAVELAEREHEAGKDQLATRTVAQGRLKTQVHALEDQLESLAASLVDATARVTEAEAEAGVGEAELAELLADARLWADGWITTTRAAIQRAEAEHERLRAVVGERERVLVEHRASEAPSLARADAERSTAEIEAATVALRRELFELEHQLERDNEHRAAVAGLGPRLAEAEAGAALWGRLRDAIGSATGDRFQKFAQSLTLELLLAQANAQLRELKPRYSLQRVPKHDLELQLLDHDLGDEIRSIQGLSGGEKFLVSLALALGLASLAAEDCRIDSLFIDEGFGTLDPHSLDIAVSTLDTLQAEGRQIGVISHVPGLAERVGVEIRVEPVSSGRSRIRVVEPHSAGTGLR